MTDCIFCKLVKKEIPNEPLVETNRLIIVRDRAPVAKEHLLAIPKVHYDNITEAPPIDEVSYVMYMAATFARDRLPNGFRLVINTGADAGQTVRHFHVHVIGGQKLGDL